MIIMGDQKVFATPWSKLPPHIYWMWAIPTLPGDEDMNEEDTGVHAMTEGLLGDSSSVETCEACYPTEDQLVREDDLGIAHLWKSEKRDTYVVAPKRHTMEVTLKELQACIQLARKWSGPDVRLRVDAIDVVDHFSGHIVVPTRNESLAEVS